MNDKKSFYTCNKCESAFVHSYNIIPNIFEAIKQSGVPDICLGEQNDKIDN